MIKEIEATELAQLKQTDANVRVIDVRQPAELLRGIIPGSEGVPMHTIPLRMSELSKDVKTVLVCHSGARSAQACMYLMQQGYENVFNLRGGMMAWHGNGHEIGLPATA